MAPAIHLSLDISFPVWTLRRQWSHTFLLSVSLPPRNMGQHGEQGECPDPTWCPLSPEPAGHAAAPGDREREAGRGQHRT